MTVTARAAPLVYVVEDDLDLRDMLVVCLQDLGFAVAAFADGEAVVAAAGAHAPDVLLLDLWLRGIDGIEVARRLRDAPPTRPIRLVAMTGHAAALGPAGRLFDAFLAKPFGADLLDETIRRLAAPRRVSRLALVH